MAGVVADEEDIGIETSSIETKVAEWFKQLFKTGHLEERCMHTSFD